MSVASGFNSSTRFIIVHVSLAPWRISIRGWGQWSFRKTGTMGMIAGEASGNLCLGPSTRGASAGLREYHLRQFLRLCGVFKILQSSAFLAGKWFAMPSIMRS